MSEPPQGGRQDRYGQLRQEAWPPEAGKELNTVGAPLRTTLALLCLAALCIVPAGAVAAAANSSTKAHIMGYTAVLPANVAQQTPGILAELTPEGLVWVSYAGALPLGKTYAVRSPYAVYISSGGGSGALRPGRRALAKLPYRQIGKIADLAFLAATGDWLGFFYEAPGSTETLTAGMLNLRTGAVRFAPQRLTKGAKQLDTAGGLLGIVTATGQVATFSPVTGHVASYPAAAAKWLGPDLAYGLSVGTTPANLGHAGGGVFAYQTGPNSIFYAPPGWKPFYRQAGSGMNEIGYENPSDPAERVEIVGNPCVTCFTIGSTNGSMPAPLPLLPESQGRARLLTHWLSDVELSFEGSVTGYKYPVWGDATAGSPASPGDATILVTLPPSQASLAKAILASYPLTY